MTEQGFKDLENRADDAAEKLGILSKGTEKANAAVDALSGGVLGGLAAGLADVAEQWSDRLENAFAQATEATTLFAEITSAGTNTWAQKMKAAADTVAMYEEQYEGMGGDAYTSTWYTQNMWEWVKRAVGAESNVYYEQTQKNMEAAKAQLAALEEMAPEEQGGAFVRAAFYDLGKQIQALIVGGEEQVVSLTQSQELILLGIQKGVNNLGTGI